MKNLYLPLILTTVLVLANVARADSFDSDTATIKKSGDKFATVNVDKKDYKVPVTFGDGADWSDVKDHYDLSDASVAAVKSGKAKLDVESDGTLKWTK